MKKGLIFLAVLLLLTSIITGCGNSTTTTSSPAATAPTSAAVSSPPNTSQMSQQTTNAAVTPKSGGTFRFISYQADPNEGGWIADSTGANVFAYEGMLRQQANGDMTPWLASSWDIATDTKSITFHLRPGVKFTDGTDFNAAAVKFSYDAQIAAKKAPNWASVDALDDLTVRVNIVQWKATSLSDFGDSNMASIASPAAFQKNGIEWMRKNPVGTGPFILSKFTQDATYEYIKNPNYWQKGKPYMDGFQVIIITNPSTQENAMQAGEGDATMVELGKMTADFQNMKLNIAAQIQAVNSLVPDTQNADSPWANQKVREAAEYAINKEALATGMGYGLWQAPYQVPPRGNAIYNEHLTTMRKYDPDMAKKLLADAGYAGGFKTTIIPFPGAVSRDVTMAVVGDLAKVGIIADPQFVDFGKYLEYNDNGWNNGVLFAPVPSYPYYIQTLNTLFDPDNSLLYKKGWLRTPEFIAALKAANNVVSPDVALTRAVTDIWIKDASVIPVYEGGKSYAFQSYVKDAAFLTRGFPNYWNWESVWLDK